MKKVLVIFLLLVTSLSVSAGNAHTPAAVTKAFHERFPGISAVKWELEHGNYEANFTRDGEKMSATFDKNGSLLETEKSIPVNTLPAEAATYIEKNCNGKKPKAASEIKLANGDTNYEAQVAGKDYIFDAHGKFLKTQKD
jgi:hypothetical protein